MANAPQFQDQPNPQAKSGIKLAQPKAATPAQSQAAVPITVYRQLANEFQVLQAQTAHLQAENQALLTQNRQMSTALQQIADYLAPLQIRVDPEQFEEMAVISPRAADYPATFAPQEETVETVSAERYSGDLRQRRQRPPAINHWVLWFAMIVIMVVALGGGFMVVRSLLSNPSGD
ncbi:hypothetical protein VB712_10280 [Spirulina sp. CCNP1310]|uniref:hypothetical protein n=1 Tax=Spirulina sp. CCNP1310 TaxID=3110249 RepID=UPI002B20B80C|nr:hypothetical protein [Spirulina sp. CCNP1310]MEA5419609.1 hypothetical protein [Spirulina sp. CCNP1310]